VSTKTSTSSAKALLSFLVKFNLGPHPTFVISFSMLIFRRELPWKMKWQNNKGWMWSKVNFYLETGSAFAAELDVFVNTEYTEGKTLEKNLSFNRKSDFFPKKIRFFPKKSDFSQKNQIFPQKSDFSQFLFWEKCHFIPKK
jgi:hypothetical protein